jgi:N-acetylglucosaminyldiphosphoundecaprenol N-acetyl-beta-D-mannosaminyltransferase
MRANSDVIQGPDPAGEGRRLSAQAHAGAERRLAGRRGGVRRLEFLGPAFDRIGLDEAAGLVERQARSGAAFTYAVTPNVDHVMRLERRPELARAYERAWMTLCDSRIIARLARMSGLALPAAPGADLVQRLFERYIRPDDRVAVIGGSAGAIATLRATYGLENLVWLDAPQGLAANAAARTLCARFIADAKAQWVFLAVGSPQQEQIAEEAAGMPDTVGVGICCGASLDFLTGRTARAPLWMRKAGLEWLHRLGSEPGRLWRRYLIDGPGIFALWLRQKRR